MRTLHHYDEIGLLVPNRRTAAGYRSTATTICARLQQIMFYRELGFGLEQIMSDPRRSWGRGRGSPAPAARAAARAHRPSPGDGGGDRERDGGTSDGGLVDAGGTVRDLRARTRTSTSAASTRQEAEQRWGQTEPYQQSRRRTSAYTKQDWLQIKAEADGERGRFRRGVAVGRRSCQPGSDGPGRGAPAAHQSLVLRLQLRDPVAAWPRCMWPTRGSPNTTRPFRRDSPNTCTTPSWPTRRATVAERPRSPMSARDPHSSRAILMRTGTASQRPHQDPLSARDLDAHRPTEPTPASRSTRGGYGSRLLSGHCCPRGDERGHTSLDVDFRMSR